MNTELLLKVKEHILAEPKRLDMGVWVGEKDGDNAPACGTVGCIAGWAVLLSYSQDQWKKIVAEKYFDIEGEAKNILGLSAEEAQCLFRAYYIAEGLPGSIEVAAKIDALIADSESFVDTWMQVLIDKECYEEEEDEDGY